MASAPAPQLAATPEALGLQLALNAVGGSQSELARICGCTPAAVWQMVNKKAPALSVPYVLKVETALHIPRHILRPDIYPAPAVAALAEG